MNFEGQSVLRTILAAGVLVIAYPAISSATVIDININAGPQNVLPGDKCRDDPQLLSLEF
jgi:hypothetical protein